MLQLVTRAKSHIRKTIMKTRKIASIASVCLLSGAAAFATPVTPQGTVGSLPSATFDGTGDPTTPVEISQYSSGGVDITLGLAAQQRYFNPALKSHGGVYYAAPGHNTGGPGSTSTVDGALWNVDVYASLTGGSGIFSSGYTFDLLYNTTADGSPTEDGSLATASLFGLGDTTTTTFQDSENLEFASVFGPGFDPNAKGTYSFILEAHDAGGNLVAESAIDVAVGVPDAATNAGLLGLGLAGLLAFRVAQRRGVFAL